MQKWIISANGKIYNHAAAFAKFGYIDWTQKAKYSIGDEVYIYCTRPYKRIMYKTKVVAISMPFKDITDDKEFWYDLEKYEQKRSRVYARLQLIEQADNENLTLEKLCLHGLNAAPQGPAKMKQELAKYVDRFLHDNFSSNFTCEFEVPTDCYEGAKYSIQVNRYERSSIARMKCIERHGCKCIVCGMSFEKAYGDLGKGFIHIHHIIPISTIGKEYKINYETDLVPVCPNCHAMLHHGINGKTLTISELKQIIESSCKH